MASFLAPVSCPINHLLIRNVLAYLRQEQHWHGLEMAFIILVREAQPSIIRRRQFPFVMCALSGKRET